MTGIKKSLRQVKLIPDLIEVKKKKIIPRADITIYKTPQK